LLSSNTDVLSPMVGLIADLMQDWRRLDERIEVVSTQIEALAQHDTSCQRLMTVPGVGPINSSAVVAVIGSGAGFKQGRAFGAWLGLVPKQESTGDRTILGKISKRGNKHLRMLFVQAAHVVLVRRPSAAMRGLRPWIEQASRRLHRNTLAIELANKLARIAWAVLARGRAYQPRTAANAARQKRAQVPLRKSRHEHMFHSAQTPDIRRDIFHASPRGHLADGISVSTTPASARRGPGREDCVSCSISCWRALAIFRSKLF
jgi:hypothetical protein